MTASVMQGESEKCLASPLSDLGNTAIPPIKPGSNQKSPFILAATTSPLLTGTRGMHEVQPADEPDTNHYWIEITR